MPLHSLRVAGALVALLTFSALGSRAADPLPAPIDPRGLPGPLVLGGGGKLPPDARKAFFDLAGKDKAKIVVLTTPDAQERANDLVKAWEELKPTSVVILHTRNPKKADDADFVKPLADATGVWLHNTDARNLITAYRGTLVEKELKKLHARGGVIGGTGGGESAMGALLVGVGEEPVAGLGLLPGFIIDEKLTKVIAARPTHIGLEIPDEAAVVIRGRVARVIGDFPITVHIAKGAGKPAANEEYKPGSLLDLVQLQRAAFNRAAKDSFPPAKPAAPVVAKGSLVIVGGGGAAAEIWKRFIELAGGPDSTIVVVTSAMEDPLAPESSEEKALKRYGAKNVVALHTRDRKEADGLKFSDVLLKAKGVWFSGGRQWRFVDSYEGTLTEKRFRDVLVRGGVIGGSSAGASIQSEFMPRGHPLGNTVMAAEGYERGFGYLPGCAVDQHFFARKRTADMTELMKEYPQYLGIGLDEGTAIVVTASTAEVIGKTKVAFYDTKKKPDGDKDYEEVFAGEKYDLKERKKIK
ncbi:cyanophycinase [Gemmata sp. G18]|uniref:Cyanophycinase n=1 Tax=Gemmata palustris TaxID=2822762 RepID=A0ABS5BZ44_9BACT|nr:cyanophycinase [Gemmata palustris]MBP3958958.1 cyanophycinase [Gemmata palustris]